MGFQFKPAMPSAFLQRLRARTLVSVGLRNRSQDGVHGQSDGHNEHMRPNHALERTQPQRAFMDGVEMLRRSARSR